MIRYLTLAAAVCAMATPCLAQQVENDDFTYVDGILVTSADVLTCPYKLVQPITINVTEDFGADSRNKIFGKFRDEAKKLSADAVVSAAKGGRHMTAFAWTRREYTGKAIRYVNHECAPVR